MRMSSIEHALLVDDVDDVQRFAVLAVLADVVEHLLDGPLFLDGDVVPASSADRSSPPGSRAACSRSARSSGVSSASSCRVAGGRQFLEEHGAVVRRHVVEQRRDVLLRHRLEQGLLLVERQVLEGRRRVLARQQAEDHDLVLDAEVAQQ